MIIPANSKKMILNEFMAESNDNEFDSKDDSDNSSC